MKDKIKNIKDILFLLLLIISTLLLLNPLNIIMTDSISMISIGIISLIVIAVLIFTWKENPKDEREELHLYIASRISFFLVTTLLLVALIVQTFNHNIDPWIPLSLCILLISKIIIIFYLRIKK